MGCSQAEIMKQYEEAVTYMQKGNYTAAHPALEKLLKIAPPQLTDRIRMYLSACIAQANKAPAEFSSPEEKYDYADLPAERRPLRGRARTPGRDPRTDSKDADYAFYGLAVLASMTGDAQNCLEKLTEAIRLNGVHRIHARVRFRLSAHDRRSAFHGTALSRSVATLPQRHPIGHPL